MRCLMPVVVSMLLLALTLHEAGVAGQDGGEGDENPRYRYFLYAKYDAGYDTYKYYLQTERPLVDVKARVVLAGGSSSVTFTHHIVGRKVNDSIEPYAELFVNSNSEAGKVVKATMRFDADNDGDFEAVYRFGPFTTVTTQQTETLWLDYSSREGELMDMKGESGGLVEFRVSRDDDQNESLILYCGAYNQSSYVHVPYSDPIPIGTDDDDGDDDDAAPDTQVLYFAVAIGALIAVGAVLTWLKLKAPPAYEVGEPGKRGRGGKRRKPGGKRRKGRGRRRKGKRKAKPAGDNGGPGGEQ